MPDFQPDPVKVDAVVIGAGMAGVTAARALKEQGIDVLIVEAGDRVGGRVWSLRDFAGVPVEAGAEFIHGVGAATWTDVRAAGLRVQPVPYLRNSWFNLGGGTRWLPVALMNPSVWRSFDILWSLGRLKGADHSGAEFIQRKGYKRAARQLAGLTLTAHLPGSLDEVGVQGLAADGVLHLENGLNHRVLDGYDSLPAHIAEGLSIRTGFRVEMVRWSADGVEVVADDGQRVRGRVGITTMPHGVVTSGRVTFDPPLPDAKRSAFDRVATGPVVKLLMAFDEAFWPRSMAQLVCGDGPVTLYWPTSFGTDGPAVLTAYATGPRARGLSDAGPEQAVELVKEDLDRLYPKVRPGRLVTSARMIDWSTDPNALGGYTFLPPGAVGARADLGAPTTGALLWGGSATAWEPVAATVEAAFLSGLRAAEQALHLLDDLARPAT